MYLRKSDRNGILLLLLIIVIVLILFPFLKTPESVRQYQRQQRSQRLPLSSSITSMEVSSPLGEVGRGAFYFDPNTADSTTLLRLGLSRWQVRNIYRYRARGGRFRQKEDFAQLYGLTLEQYRKLEPYIRIEPEVMARDVIKKPTHASTSHSSISTSHSSSFTSHSSSSSKLRSGETVDINTADTLELKRIPGIGSYFARRIVELRQRRQTFVSPEELLAIRNLPETALTYMTASQNFPKIQVNNASLQQLKAHPLINHTQATDILRYRRLNGPILSPSDLSTLPSFSKEQLVRLAPFLIFD